MEYKTRINLVAAAIVFTFVVFIGSQFYALCVLVDAAMRTH